MAEIIKKDNAEDDDILEAIALGKIEGCGAYRALAQTVSWREKETDDEKSSEK